VPEKTNKKFTEPVKVFVGLAAGVGDGVLGGNFLVCKPVAFTRVQLVQTLERLDAWCFRLFCETKANQKLPNRKKLPWNLLAVWMVRRSEEVHTLRPALSPISLQTKKVISAPKNTVYVRQRTKIKLGHERVQAFRVLGTVGRELRVAANALESVVHALTMAGEIDGARAHVAVHEEADDAALLETVRLVHREVAPEVHDAQETQFLVSGRV
jgi:hypothetical protein